VRAVRVDGANGDEQARRDLLVRAAECEQVQDVALAKAGAFEAAL
jgi:hypothetical protein